MLLVKDMLRKRDYIWHGKVGGFILNRLGRHVYKGIDVQIVDWNLLSLCWMVLGMCMGHHLDLPKMSHLTPHRCYVYALVLIIRRVGWSGEVSRREAMNNDSGGGLEKVCSCGRGLGKRDSGGWGGRRQRTDPSIRLDSGWGDGSVKITSIICYLWRLHPRKSKEGTGDVDSLCLFTSVTPWSGLLFEVHCYSVMNPIIPHPMTSWLVSNQTK